MQAVAVAGTMFVKLPLNARGAFGMRSNGESHSGNMERTVDYLITLSPQVCVGAFARSRVPVRARARVCACVCRVSDSQSFPHANLMSPRGRAGA